MYSKTKSLTKNIGEVLNEIEAYERCKDNMINSVNKLNKDHKKHDSPEYLKKLNKILKGKTKKEWFEYYNSYILLLSKQVDVMLSQIICSIGDER